VNARRFAFLAGAALFLSSCIATQKDVLDLSQQSDELKEQVEELKKTVGSLQANQADLSVSIKQLREELTAYTETVKASQGDMSKLSTKLDDLGAQISGKVAALGQTISQAQTKGLEDQKAALAEVKREGGATDAFVTAEKRPRPRISARPRKASKRTSAIFRRATSSTSRPTTSAWPTTASSSGKRPDASSRSCSINTRRADRPRERAFITRCR
jgi:chromosome segregation ATPase